MSASISTSRTVVSPKIIAPQVIQAKVVKEHKCKPGQRLKEYMKAGQHSVYVC